MSTRLNLLPWREMRRREQDRQLLTIGFDQEIETTRKRVADWHLGGVHTFAGSKGQQALPQDYFGSPSTLCIIGPDGKVLAKNLNTLDAEQEVATVTLER